MAHPAEELLAALRTPEGRRDPTPLWAEFHRLGPASPIGSDGSPYAAVVNGFDAVTQVLKDPRFVKTLGAGADPVDAVLRRLGGSMMFRDEPDHLRMRQVFQSALTPRRLAAFEPVVVKIVDDLLTDLERRGPGVLNFVDEFGYRLPITVIGTLLGVPRADLGWFRDRTQRIDDYLDLGGKDAETLRLANAAAEELAAYYSGMIADRRARPTDDLVSALITHEALSDEELVNNLVVLVNASFVTTMNMLANGLALLLEDPARVASLRVDPVRCVEEVLRYEGSVQMIGRLASEDLEVAGVPVPAGRMVLILLAAAGRDPARHPDAETFDLDREDTQHLAFGAGTSFCVGAALARMEGQVAFPRLFERFPTLAPAGEPVRSPSLLLRGYLDLPVRLNHGS